MLVVPSGGDRLDRPRSHLDMNVYIGFMEISLTALISNDATVW